MSFLTQFSNIIVFCNKHVTFLSDDLFWIFKVQEVNIYEFVIIGAINMVNSKDSTPCSFYIHTYTLINGLHHIFIHWKV